MSMFQHQPRNPGISAFKQNKDPFSNLRKSCTDDTKSEQPQVMSPLNTLVKLKDDYVKKRNLEFPDNVRDFNAEPSGHSPKKPTNWYPPTANITLNE